jgi:putative transposase
MLARHHGVEDLPPERHHGDRIGQLVHKGRDAEWARLAPLIPPASTGGRPRKTEMRAAINAILYPLRIG